MSKDAKSPIPFAIIICVCCSLILAAIHSTLKDEQDLNKRVDMQYNVLKALHIDGIELFNEKGKRVISSTDIENAFETSITSIVLDATFTNTVDISVFDLKTKDIEKKIYNPIFVYTDKDPAKSKYAIHISGKGLWSTINGYMAIEADAATIAGVSFYSHGETPGLGGEIEKEWFYSQFAGKKIYDVENSIYLPFLVMKGKVNELILGKTPADDLRRSHSVDGISAATITCNGLNTFINKDIQRYSGFLNNKRALRGSK